MGTRITWAGADKVYKAAQLWVERALRADDSLFRQGTPIWSAQRLAQLRERFLDNPDESRDDFFEKLRGQLDESPNEVYQLMGEVLYVHFLVANNIGGGTKIDRIRRALRLAPTPVDIPPELMEALNHGILNPGTGFNTYRFYQLGLIIEFVEQWKHQPDDERERVLNNPWKFKEFLMEFEATSDPMRSRPNTPRAQRQALLHLVYPDIFEAMVNVDHKNDIARAFAEVVDPSEVDLDRKLGQIRRSLEPRYGSKDHLFYMDPIRVQWDRDYKPDPWESFVAWARRFYGWSQFHDMERGYKLRAGEALGAVKKALADENPDWESLLTKTLRDPANGLRDWRAINAVVELEPSRKEQALQRIWGIDSSDSLKERVRGFQEYGRFGTPGVMASILLMAEDPTGFPMYGYTPLKTAYQLTGYPVEPNDSTDAWERYEHALGFFDEFMKQASNRGLQITDFLDAQSLVWCVTRYEKEFMPDDWTDDEKDQLIFYREGGRLTPPPPPPTEDPWSPSKVAALAGNLLWKPEEVQEIVEDLQEKRQVIFYGPPGTGKTYVARAIAQQCRLNGGDFEIVQFHPSYSYEDFVEGFRPRLIDGHPGFELVPGPLLRIADKARERQESTFVLVIDEMNRGNVAKVFGELYFLLEYRDEEVQLQYGAERGGFSLPSNLWFICTMNTADRSIALMDAALRRRFYFAPFFPDEPPIKGLLRRWLARQEQDTWAADLVDAANRKLDRDMGIGPSYFMGGGPLDRRRLSRIWNRSVLPYIEEQFFGDSAKLAEFNLERLTRQAAQAAEAEAVVPGGQPDDGDVPVQDGDDDSDPSRI